MAAASEAPRVIHAQSLDLEMSMDVIANAVFAGNTTFEEQGLRAEAAEARYLPSKQTLRLIGTTEDGVPRISDERLTIDAVSIDVGLTDRHIVATGRVKTTLKPDTGRTGTGGKETNRVPGLLRGTEQVNVTAEALSYLASSGVAVYSKSARLWQADTEIRGETIELQQTRGDLIAEGDARSSIPFDSGQSEGRGGRIQYVDADRVITYLSSSKGPTSEARPARLTGPEGDVSGERIEVRLAPGENRVDRVDATGGVSATVDARTATGDRLTYRADNETYRVTGTAKTPMTLAESCNVWTGRTLTFSRSADTMVIDGQAQSRTENKRRSSCP
jgi:lipopolysaccharide export system protein LptA